MTEFDAHYYDGRSSTDHAVRVRSTDGSLAIAGGDIDLSWPLSEVTLIPPVAGSRHTLALKDGGQLRTDDAPAIARIFADFVPRDAWQRRLESRWPVALVALVATVAIATAVITYGIPHLAKDIAANMPVKVEDALGRASLESIDQVFCKPSKLPEARRRELTGKYLRLTEGVPNGSTYLLEFRDCKLIGANAFALPADIVVMTDQLVQIAKDDEQILAVLAHEVGHSVHNHPTRMALQASGVAFLLTGLAGDAAAITSLAVILPTALLESGYSRDFEREADDFAIERLGKLRIPPSRLAEMLDLLEESHRMKKAEPRNRGTWERSLDYFSTHPPTDERKKRVESAR